MKNQHEVDHAVFEAIVGTATTAGIQSATGFGPTRVRKALLHFEEAGCIQRGDHGRWELTDQGGEALEQFRFPHSKKEKDAAFALCKLRDLNPERAVETRSAGQTLSGGVEMQSHWTVNWHAALLELRAFDQCRQIHARFLLGFYSSLL